ncbi:MAG: hypothetical protein ACAI38_05270 [Myxococcota bacterium]
MVVLLACAVARAEVLDVNSTRPTIVVIPTRSPGGPDLSKDTGSLFEAPLAKNATVLPFETYRRGVLANGHLARDAADLNVIKHVGPLVGASHVVVVQGMTVTETERGRSVQVNVVEVSLVATTGETLYTTKRPLTGARLTRSAALPIVAVISGKLATLPAFDPSTQPTPSTVPDAVATVPVPPSVPATLPVEPVPPPPSTVEPTAPQPTVAIADNPTLEGDHRLAAPIVIDEARPERAMINVEPTFDGRLGILTMQRDGRVRGSGGRASYDGPLVASSLSFAYFPWARRPKEKPSHGVGLYAEGYITRASTDFRAGSSSSDNTVAGAEIGGAYRFALGATTRAPAVTLQAGFAYATFPMTGLPFPATSYRSAALGFVLDVPLVKHLAAFAGGRFYPWMATGSDALGEADSLMAVRAELGLRAVIQRFELVAAGRFQQYNGNFSGATDLALASQLEDVRLVDRYYGGVFSIGYVF